MCVSGQIHALGIRKIDEKIHINCVFLRSFFIKQYLTIFVEATWRLKPLAKLEIYLNHSEIRKIFSQLHRHDGGLIEIKFLKQSLLIAYFTSTIIKSRIFLYALKYKTVLFTFLILLITSLTYHNTQTSSHFFNEKLQQLKLTLSFV